MQQTQRQLQDTQRAIAQDREQREAAEAQTQRQLEALEREKNAAAEDGSQALLEVSDRADTCRPLAWQLSALTADVVLIGSQTREVLVLPGLVIAQ